MAKATGQAHVTIIDADGRIIYRGPMNPDITWTELKAAADEVEADERWRVGFEVDGYSITALWWQLFNMAHPAVWTRGE